MVRLIKYASLVFGIPLKAFLAPTGTQEEAMSCVRVRASVTLFKRTLKVSSSSILKSPGGF